MRCIVTNDKKEIIIDSLNSVFNDAELITLEAKFKRLGEDLSPTLVLDDERSISVISDIINEWIPEARDVAELFEDNVQLALLTELEETKDLRITDLRKAGVAPANKAAANLNMDIKEESLIDYQEKITSSTINNLYRSAQQPRNLMQDELRRSVISSFLVDFKEGRIVRSSQEFNKNLAALFNRLLTDLKIYAEEAKVDFDNSLLLYDEDGKYTGQFSVVQKLADTLFGDKFNATYLNHLYATRTSSFKSSKALRAYNSYVILNNFDTLLKTLLGKTITIDQRYVDSFTDVENDKYKLLDNSNLVKTWRSSDDVDALSEMGNITKILVEQTPVLHYPTGENKFNNYLEVKDFTYVFNKLKNIPIFSEIVNKIRFAPNKFIPELIDTALKTNTRGLTAHDKDIIFSVQRRFYKNNFDVYGDSEYSLTEIINKEYAEGSDSVLSQNLVDFISGMIDKTVSTNYIGYRPSDSGNIEIFDVKDNNLNSHKLIIEKGINNINNTLSTEYRKDLLDKYSVRRNGAKLSIRIPGYTTKNGHTLHIVHANNSSRGISVFTVDSNRNQSPLSLNEMDRMVAEGDTDLVRALTEFLDDTLYQSLGLQPEILDAFREIVEAGSDISAIMQLAALGGRSLMRNQIEKELTDGTMDKASVAECFPEAYSKETTLFDKKTGSLKTVIADQANIVRDLARARMLVNGEAAKSNSRDLSGNSISNNGLTNLINTAKVNWLEAKHLAGYGYNVASLGSIFVKNPNLIFGTTVKKEAQSKDRSVTKSSAKFFSSEIAHSSVLYDFWSGFLNKDGDMAGKFYIQPTVYSDKSRHYLIGIDGMQVLTPTFDETTGGNVGGKRITESTAEDIRNVHYASMAQMYRVMRTNLLADYQQTLAPILPMLGISNITTFSDAERVFDAINAKYKLKKDVEFFRSKGIPVSPENEAEYQQIMQSQMALANSPQDLYMLLAKEANTEVIDQIHFSGKGTLGINKLLKHYFEMFLDDAKTRSIYNAKVLREKKKFARDLLNNNKFFLYDKRGEIDPVLNKFIHGSSESERYSIWAGPDYESKWVDPDTAEIIIAKLVDKNGKETRLTKNSLFDPKDSQGLILNPLFDMFFEVDNLISSNFLTSTVGGPYGHPLKSRIDANADEVTKIEQEEAARTLAQFKRMVIYPATMHNYVQNQFNGIPPQYNVATIRDMSASVHNFSGVTSKVDVQDGSGWANPFIAILENYSLNDAKAGEDKKPIGHSMNPMYLSELELKYALMDIYNERVRDSGKPDNKGLRWKNILKKMTDRQWDVPVDLTVAFNGKPINIAENIQNPYYRDIVTGKFYKITDIKRTGDNLYDVTQVQVNKMGNVIGQPELKGGTSLLIDTNYKLWEVFGGEWSCDLTDLGLFEGNSSIEAVAWYMNNIGVVRSKENSEIYGTDFKQELYTFGEDYEELPSESEIRNPDGTFTDFANLSQIEVYQPLKHSDIHYLVNTSGAKCGATNINPTSSWFDDTPLRSFKMSTRHLGIQMDADHHADDSELTEMSQVISSLEANGYTHHIAKEAYHDLGSIVYSTMKREIDAVAEYYKMGDSREIYNIVGKSFLKSFDDSSSNKASLAEAIVYNMKKELGKYLKISEADVKLPFSDNNLLGAVISSVTSMINKTAIKRKYPGIASVLIPSHGAIQIYKANGIDYTYGQAQLSKVDFNHQFNMQPIIPITDIEFGESYVVVEGTQGYPVDVNGVVPEGASMWDGDMHNESQFNLNVPGVQHITVDSIEKYNELRNDTSGRLVKRNPYKGRDLQPSRTLFKIGGRQYSIFDSDSIKSRYAVEKAFDKGGVIDLAKSGDIDAAIEILRGFRVPNDLVGTKLNELANKLANKDFWRISNLVDDIKNLYRDDVINTFKRLSADGTVIINDEVKTIDPESLEIKEAELVLPKIYATKFGLRRGDSLNDIMKNENFFYNRIIDAWNDKTTKYDIALKRANGNHTYIILKSGGNAKVVEGLQKVNVNTIVEDGENTLRVNNKGEIEGPLNDAEVYVDSRGNEIIFTDNVKQFLEEQYDDYDDVELNSGLKEGTLNTAFDVVKGIDHKLTEQYKEIALRMENNESVTLKLALQEKNTHLDRMFRRLSREKRTSFLKSLEFIAARIPAQSMQSFMPMKVVAFSESEKNIAYVSHWQIWLQGSDFDIDKVYLMGSEFSDNGKYIGWSPYFNLYSDEVRKASELLPMPSGKEYQVFYPDVQPEDSFDITQLVKNVNLAASDKLGTNTKRFIIALADLLKGIRDSGYTKLWLDPKSIIEANWMNLDTVEKRINRHSLYLSKIKSPDRIISMMKNSVSSKIYRIINDPANMVSAYSPIEMNEPQAAAELSESGKEAKEYTLGNPFVKWNMQYQNMTGKDVIGIAAVGEKVFFALSYYYNEAARSGNMEWQENAYFRRSFKLIKSRDGKKYLPLVRNIIANVNFDGVDTSKVLWNSMIEQQSGVSMEDSGKKYTEEEVAYIREQLLSQLGSQKDASLVISALLSAATDNAKELILAKINSGSDLASVYLYSIMLGIDFKDIANLMISNTVQTIAKLNKTNIFDEYNQSSTIDSVFNKLENGLQIKNYLNKFEGLNEAIAAVYPKAGGKSTQAALTEIFKQDNRLELLKKLREEFKTTEIYKNNGFPKFNLMRFMSDFEELAVMADSIFKNELSRTEYYTFKRIYKLAQEVKQLGSILSANQGLQTNMFDKFGYLDRIEQAVKDRVEEYVTGAGDNRDVSIFKILEDKPYLEKLHGGKEGAKTYVESIVRAAKTEGMIDDFNTLRFLNDDEYRRLAVSFYNLIKGTINVLDVITRVPHFRATIDMAATDFGIFDAISAKFTNVYNLSKLLIRNVYNVSSSKDRDSIYRNVGNFLDSVINTKWFKDRGTSFTIAEGDRYFDKYGHTHQATGNEVIDLGTGHGQATFKMWFENTVVPSLKRGLQEKNGERKLSLARNKFISALQLSISDRTLTRDVSYAWTLPMNMSSINSITEMNNYVEYLTHFDELDKYTFNGTPVSELFFYYNMIVNKNRYGQTSLTRLFEHFVGEKQNSVVQDYFKYIGDMDFNKLLNNSDYSLEDVIMACAITVSGGNYGKKFPYIKVFNPLLQTYELFTYMGEFNSSEQLPDDVIDNLPEGDASGPANYKPVVFPNQKELMNYFTWLPMNFSKEQDAEPLEDKLLKLINQNRAIVKYEC